MELFKQAGQLVHGAHPLPRHRAGLHRPAGRPDAGDVPGLAAAVPHIRSGRVRPLAVTGKRASRCSRTCRRWIESASRASTRSSGMAWSARPGCPHRCVKQLNESLWRHCSMPRPAREAVDRGGRAHPDERPSSSASSCAPTSRAGPSWPRPARSSSTAEPSSPGLPHGHGPQHPGRRRPRRPADHRASWRASSPRTRPRLERRRRPRSAPHLLNWVGCAVGAAHHERPCAALAAVQMLQPAPQASPAGPARARGHGQRGAAQRHQLAHLRLRRHAPEDHHPPGRSGGLGACWRWPSTWRQRPRADRRAGAGHRRVVPRRQRDVPRPLRPRLAHHRLTGMLGAAAACARLLGLDEQRTAMALGIAASQPVGLREQFGTMTKPFHPGGAARAGLMSALMAQHGFTASPRALEAPRGLVQVVSTKNDWPRPRRAGPALRDLASTPTSPSPAASSSTRASTPACSCATGRAARAHRAHRAQGAFAGARTHRQEGAADGLQAKFSVYHGCAAGLILRPRRRRGVRRRHRQPRRRGGAAPQGGGHGGRRHRRGQRPT
jgi:hypothetical protein